MAPWRSTNPTTALGSRRHRKGRRRRLSNARDSMQRRGREEGRRDTSGRRRPHASPARTHRSRTSPQKHRKESPRCARRKANPIRTRRSQTQLRSTPGESGTRAGGRQEQGSESRRGKAVSEVEGEERMESGPVETTVSKERDGCQERGCEIEEHSLLGRFRLRVNRREKIRRGGARTRGSSQSLRSKGNNPSEDSVKDSLSQSERSIPRHTLGVRAKPQAGHMQPGTKRAAALPRGKGRRGKKVRIENWYQHSPSSSSNERGCVDDRNSEDPEGKEDFKQRSRRKRARRYSEEESEDEVDKAQTTLLSDSPETPVLVHHMTRRRKAQCLHLSPSSNSRVTAPSKSILCKNSFKSLYSLGSMLGKGGCGAVYAAICKTNGRQVAIKYVKKGMAEPYVKLPGLGQQVPLEVALMQIVSHPPACPYVLQLLEWFQEAERFILVLERPYPCMDLFDFIEVLGGQMDECLARAVMIQVVLAACHCRERGVLHRDVKVENLLVQTDTLRVKLIDFGCGDLLRTSSYRDYSGTEEFCPPEWVLRGVYQGRPATVWSLGVLLFSMVCGYLPFNQEADIISGRPRFTKDLSKQCKKLIGWCLERDPTKRPVLEQILLHDWMIASEASVHSRPTVHPPPSRP